MRGFIKNEKDYCLQVPLVLECGHDNFRKETDIMDVWFDSGSSHVAVSGTRPELQWPADLYLEGSDQYRGWYNSSLITASLQRGSHLTMAF